MTRWVPTGLPVASFPLFPSVPVKARDDNLQVIVVAHPLVRKSAFTKQPDRASHKFEYKLCFKIFLITKSVRIKMANSETLTKI